MAQQPVARDAGSAQATPSQQKCWSTNRTDSTHGSIFTPEEHTRAAVRGLAFFGVLVTTAMVQRWWTLDDTEQRKGMSGSWNGKEYRDPRICDFAGHVLNQLDGARFPFDLAAPMP